MKLTLIKRLKGEIGIHLKIHKVLVSCQKTHYLMLNLTESGRAHHQTLHHHQWLDIVYPIHQHNQVHCSQLNLPMWQDLFINKWEIWVWIKVIIIEPTGKHLQLHLQRVDQEQIHSNQRLSLWHQKTIEFDILRISNLHSNNVIPMIMFIFSTISIAYVKHLIDLFYSMVY